MDLIIFLHILLLIAFLMFCVTHHRLRKYIKSCEEQIEKNDELIRQYEKQIENYEEALKQKEELVEQYRPYYLECLEEEKRREEEERRRRIQRIRDAEILY